MPQRQFTVIGHRYKSTQERRRWVSIRVFSSYSVDSSEMSQLSSIRERGVLRPRDHLQAVDVQSAPLCPLYADPILQGSDGFQGQYSSQERLESGTLTALYVGGRQQCRDPAHRRWHLQRPRKTIEPRTRCDSAPSTGAQRGLYSSTTTSSHP